MRALLLLAVVGLAACDPIWGAHTTLRDPANHPIENATVAVACDASVRELGGVVAHTDASGHAHVGSLGTNWPVGCDLFIAKPGFRTRRIRYEDLCPTGVHGCERVFDFDLVLEPE